MKNKVSVVVVTRNRARDLLQCLGSLAGQTQIPDEVVIIDNNSTDETAGLIKSFSSRVKFSVRYICLKKIGFPHVYNQGLIEASGDYVAFIDDDCVANARWYERIKYIIKNNPKVVVLLGRSLEYNAHSLIAIVRNIIDEFGKIGAVAGWRIVDHEILDSKNIVYNKNFLTKSKIKFDQNLLKYAQGASEDCDLGMQIGKAGGLAIYDRRLVAWHKDPTDFFKYYQKIKFTLLNHLVYEQKWSHYRKNIKTARPFIEKLLVIFDFSEKYKLNFWQMCLVFLHLGLTFVMTKFLRFVLSTKVKKMKIHKI